jgi:mannose-1-phosphate guanylyltransferase
VPGDFGWEDIGDFDSLATLLGEREHLQVLGESDHVLATQSSGVVVPRSGRTVAVVGLDDIVVVDTDDALLITTREHAQRVKDVVAHLRERGRHELT